MNVEQTERVKKALGAISQVGYLLSQLEAQVPDPVAQRGVLVACAKSLRAAADELDQHGWLTEEY
jgi:hypothetical protein